MTTRSLAKFLLLTVLGWGCDSGRGSHDHGRDHQGGERPAQSITHFTERTELFIEFPSLVVGEESPFAAHVTTLHDFKPLARGRVTVVLSGGGAPDETFEVTEPNVPGIFRPVVIPKHAGPRLLVIRVFTAEGEDEHDLGTAIVHDTIAAAASGAEAEDSGTALITYLKEQQWRTEFATDPASERSLRPSVLVNGEIRARNTGEALVVSPVAGRLITSAHEFPHVGIDVRHDQILAVIAPQLPREDDPASLERAATQAKIRLDHARTELARLEDLFRNEAVPERRVIEARNQHASAEAELTAARRRLEQFRGVQRSAGGQAAARVEVRAPLAGTVAAISVTPGAFVEEGGELFRIVDLDTLWLEARVPEADIGRVLEARGAWFEVEGFDRRFEVDEASGGRVVVLGAVLDPHSRTLALVFELPNPSRLLRVGMFARVHVVSGGSVHAVAVPASAVVDDGGQEVVYVQRGGETFERRPVSLGIRDGDFVQVRQGLIVGERVVVRGAYQVHLASAATSLPAHGHAH